MVSEKVNILWLSDIHFQESYSGDDDLEEYLGSFFEVIHEHNQASTVDYVLLSGDLAHKGSKEDYQTFHNMFLSKLLLKLDNPKMITIPGNHDISRDKVKVLLQEHLAGEKDLDSFFKERNKTIRNTRDTNNVQKFTTLFEEYSSYTKSLNPGILELSENYKENRLYGYAIDEKNKIIFVMINSAWFSFGDTTIEDILKQEMEKRNKVNKIKQGNDISWLLKMNEKMMEFGKLVVGGELLKKEKIKETVKRNSSEYLVVTTMHHPPHWLGWSEMYNEGSARKNYLPLVEILQEADILLTGHEHVPDYVKPSLINEGKSIHFQSGKFLEDGASRDESNRFGHNRFSVIEINNIEHTINEHRYLYDNSKNQWNATTLNFNILKSKAEVRAKSSGSIIDKKLIPSFDVAKYICEKVEENMEIVHIKPSKNINYLLKKLASGNSVRLCIIPLHEKFYEILLCHFPSDKHLIDKVCEIITEEEWASQKHIIISIVTMDFLMKNNPYDGHERNEKYGKMVEEADAYFDKFRHEIFARYEGGNSANWVKFTYLGNVRLTNIVVPSWDFDKYCTKK